MASLTSMLDNLSTAEPPATCGITREVPSKPVLGPCGQVFDQDALARWRRTRDDCPAGCNRALEHAIMTAPEKRDASLVARLEAVAGRVL